MRPPRRASTLRKLCGWLALFGLLLALGGSPAFAARGHEFAKDFGWGVLDGKAELQSCSASCKAGIAGSGEGQLSKEVAGMAVDEETHELYLVDTENHRVEVFSASGAFIAQFDGSGSFANEEGQKAPEALLKPKGIAIDNDPSSPSHGDVYVQDAGSKSHQAIDKFSASGAFINRVAKSPETEAAANLEYRGVAVDAQGRLWVEEEAGEHHRGIDDYSNAAVNAWQGFRAINVQGGLPLGGIAVDGKDNLYVRTNAGEGAVVEFNAEGQLLDKELDSEFPAVAGFGLATEAKSDDLYINNIGSVGRFAPASGGKATELERLGAGFLTAASPTNYQAGVALDAANGNLYVADSAASRIVVFALEGPKRPSIEGESVGEVTANSASLQAQINPRGAITEYHFEYGACGTPATCAQSPYEKEIPAAGQAEEILGAALDFEGHPVAVHPQDLKAATTYHFRVVAHNEKNEAGEVVAGTEVVFTTQPAESPGLPDGRAWEMVSPAHKHGTLFRRVGIEGVIEAAAAGNAFTYLADSPTEDEPQGNSNLVSVLASRHAVGSAQPGWGSVDIALPHEKATGQSVGEGQEYHFFSEDLARAAVQPLGAFNPSLSAEASEQTPFLRSNFIGEDAEAICTSGCLTPIVRSAPHPFGEEGKCPPNVVCGPRIAGGSADARHVVIEASVGLSEAPEDEGGLYEWSEGALSLVSVLSSGKPAEHANLGSSDQIARHAVSADGSRVVFSAEVSGSVHLYMREAGGEEAPHTVQLDKGIVQVGEAPRFQTASADDARVLFSENGELYLYETASGKASALTSGAKLRGLAIGAGEDASYVYFVGNGALAGVAGAVEGTCTGSGSALARCNLYELHEAGGEWSARLVAVLSGEDLPDFSQKLTGMTARVSADGRRLAFMSQQSLTGYENRDAHSGRRDEEVYEFDAASGRLACASCDPTGARPVGVEYKQIEKALAGGGGWGQSTWIAANVPGWSPFRPELSLYQSRYLSDSGRLFFNASDALVPQDVNGTEDVYQYEPAGVGGCTSSRPTYSPASGGCADLISAGKSREESAFLDASETGGDVFFLTASQLVKADFDTALDVYDAHECSISPCIPDTAEAPPPCTSEASCKAPPSPQPEIFGAPASATFSGAGNIAAAPQAATKPPTVKPKALTRAQRLAAALKVCRKQRSHNKRATCEKRARQKYRGKRG